MSPFEEMGIWPDEAIGPYIHFTFCVLRIMSSIFYLTFYALHLTSKILIHHPVLDRL